MSETVKQWQFKPHEGDKAVSVLDSDEVVFYIDDLNAEVVAQIVALHNEGKSTQDIDAYLLDEARITSDEREFVMENIINYEKLSSPEGQAAIVQAGETPLEPVVPKEGAVINTPNSDIPIVPEKKQRKQVQSPVNRTGNTAKSVSPEDFIKSLEEKIELTKLLSGVTLPEIPTTVTKSGRDLLMELHKEYKTMIGNYMERIQKM